MTEKKVEPFVIPCTLFGGIVIPQNSVPTKTDSGINVIVMSESKSFCGIKVLSIPCHRMRYRIHVAYQCDQPWELVGFLKPNVDRLFRVDLIPSSSALQHEFSIPSETKGDDAGRLLLDLHFKLKPSDGSSSSSNCSNPDILLKESSNIECLGCVQNTLRQGPPDTLRSILGTPNTLVLTKKRLPDHDLATLATYYRWTHVYCFDWINVWEWRTTEISLWTWILMFGDGIPWTREESTERLFSQVSSKVQMLRLSDLLFAVRGSALKTLLLKSKFSVSEWQADCEQLFGILPEDEKFAQEDILIFQPRIQLVMKPQASTFVTLLFVTDVSQLLQFSLLIQKILCLYITDSKFHNQRHEGIIVFLNSTDDRKARYITDEIRKYHVLSKVYFTPENKLAKLKCRAASLVSDRCQDPLLNVHIVIDSKITPSDLTWLTLISWVKQVETQKVEAKKSDAVPILSVPGKG